MSVLRIERIDVGEHELQAVVRVTDPRAMRTSAVPGLAENAMGLLPGLARHRCDNDAHKRFVDEMRDTETAHLLEHLTVEIMSLAGSPRTLPAHTEWDFSRDGRGVFRVVIAYDDDLVALGALKAAAQVVEWLFGEGERPDVDGVAASLLALR